MTAVNPVWSTEGLYLAIDTSRDSGSVALARGAEVLATARVDGAREQSARLLPRISDVMDAAGASPRSLAGVVVGAGPGSFTGVRVAAATAKGLAHALRVPLWAFSSLEAAALSGTASPPHPGSDPDFGRGAHATPGPIRYVLFDARGERVYAACYRLAGGEGDAPETLLPPRAADLDGVLGGPVPEGAAFAGDGAVRHWERIRSAGFDVLAPPAGVPTADALLRLLAARPSVAPLPDPWRWEPEYLKGSSAEARE